MFKDWKTPTYLSLLFFSSGCYMNKAIVQPWTEDYSPQAQSEYWTPTKKSLAIRPFIPLEKAVPTDSNEPLCLASVLDIALNNSTLTQQSWAEARQAAAQYGQAQSTGLPQLKGMYEFYRTRAASYSPSVSAGSSTTGAATGNSSGTSSYGAQSTASIFIELFNQWGPQFELTYTLFDFGVNSATANAARQALYYANFTHNREIQTVLNTVTNDYYSALYAKQLLEAQLANVETAKITLDAANESFNLGVQNLSDVLQARTQLLQYEISYVEQKQQLVVSTSQLLIDMGLPANLTIHLMQMPDIHPEEQTIPDLEDLIAKAMQSRPDFLAAGANLRNQEMNLKVARREVLPSFVYTLDFGKTYFSGGSNDKYDYTSYFNFSMPLFQGYYYRNNIKSAEANLNIAEANLKQMELELVQQITTSRYNIQVSFDALKYSREYLKAAQEQYAVSLAEYKAGTTDILTVVSAQSALANARATLAQNIQNWFTALADLTYAMGAPTMPPTQLKEDFE